MASRKTIPFIADVPRGESIILRYKAPSDCTFEGKNITFYAGQNKQLRVSAWVEKREGKEEFFDFPEGVGQDERYISGDDEVKPIDAIIPASKGDTLVVYAYNNSDNPDVESFKLSMMVVVDFYMGRKRVTGGVID